MAKFDGVIEAVRYKGGRIDVVRLYERRGATFSDHVLMNRAALLAGLKQGRRYVTGRRKELWASTFEVGQPVKLLGQDGDQVVTTREQAGQDQLEGVPIF
jgi:hypothetical protein